MAADYHNDARLQALFSGTYFPPRARYGRPGLEELLTAAAGQWKVKKEKLLDQAGQIEKYLKARNGQEGRPSRSLGLCTRHSGSWRIVLTVKRRFWKRAQVSRPPQPDISDGVWRKGEAA